MPLPAPAPACTRRRLLRLLAGAAAAIHPALGPSETAAFRGWCRTDPVFRIGGQTAHVRVSVDLDGMRQARELATGPTRLALAVPSGVEARHLASDNGFGFGYEVAVAEAADLDGRGPVLPVRVAVVVPMAGDVRVRAEFVPRGAAGADRRLRAGTGEGTANSAVVFVAA